MSLRKSRKEVVHLGVVVNGDGKVLMIRRSREEEGKDGSRLIWAFPGGKQEEHETGRECVVREVLSETGYSVYPILRISKRVHPQFGVPIVYHLCGLVYQSRIAEPKEPREAAKVRWMTPERVKRLATSNLNAGVRRVLDQVRRSSHEVLQNS